MKESAFAKLEKRVIKKHGIGIYGSDAGSMSLEDRKRTIYAKLEEEKRFAADDRWVRQQSRKKAMQQLRKRYGGGYLLDWKNKNTYVTPSGQVRRLTLGASNEYSSKFVGRRTAQPQMAVAKLHNKSYGAHVGGVLVGSNAGLIAAANAMAKYSSSATPEKIASHLKRMRKNYLQSTQAYHSLLARGGADAWGKIQGYQKGKRGGMFRKTLKGKTYKKR